MIHEVVEEFWQFEDGGLMPRDEYLRYMPRITSTREWYDRRAAERDPNRGLTAEVRRAEARAERERWERALEEERRRARNTSPWSSARAWVTDDVSTFHGTFQTEQNATERADLMEWYRYNAMRTGGAATFSGATSGRLSVHTGLRPTYDGRLDAFFIAPRFALHSHAMFKAEDLDSPYEVAAPGTYSGGTGGGLIGFQAEPDGEVAYFQERGCVPFAHTVRILVRYYDTVEKVQKLFKARGTKSCRLITPDPQNLVFESEGSTYFETFDYCKATVWDSGTTCQRGLKRGGTVMFKDGKWHIRARDTNNIIYWEPLDPETL